MNFSDIVGGFVVIDTETTGLKGSVIQLAWKKSDDSPFADIMYDPEIPIEYGAMAVHGITNKQLQSSDTKSKDYVTKVISDLIEGRFVVGHNMTFDAEAIERTFGISLPKDKLFCTLRLADYLGLKDVVGSLSNGALYYYFKEQSNEDIGVTNFHDANYDVSVTLYNLGKLLELAGNNNLSELKERMDTHFIKTCRFPKHDGVLWEQVVVSDKSYVEWLINNDKISGDTLDYLIGLMGGR